MTVGFLLAFLLGCLAAPGRADPGVLETTLSAGFDSFGERYSIDEADTLDFTSEFRSIVGLRYSRGWERGHDLELQNTFSLSGNAIRNLLRAELDLVRRDDDRFSLSNELAIKRFDRGDDYTVVSDHLQETVRASYLARLGEALRMRFGQRLEMFVFSEPSSYEYDYRRAKSAVDLEIVHGLDAALDLGYAFTFRDVPDSSAIDYLDHAVRGDVIRYFGLSTTLDLNATLARRRYRDETARPGYYLLDGDGRLAVRVGERYEVQLRQEFELYDYDIPGDIYFNSFQHLSGIEVAFEPGVEVRLGIEPRFGFLTATSDGEEYQETSVVLSGDWIRLDGLWLTASVELGRRDYRAVEESLLSSGTDAGGNTTGTDLDGISTLLYSDYAFTRVNVFATYEFAGRYAFNLYLSHEPERHDDEDDDTTMTLLSTDLTVRF